MVPTILQHLQPPSFSYAFYTSIMFIQRGELYMKHDHVYDYDHMHEAWIYE